MYISPQLKKINNVIYQKQLNCMLEGVNHIAYEFDFFIFYRETHRNPIHHNKSS